MHNMLYFNKKSLNVNSLVSESQERVDNIKLSVEKAKEAVSLDVSDGVSWCKYSTLTVITLILLILWNLKAIFILRPQKTSGLLKSHAKKEVTLFQNLGNWRTDAFYGTW